MNLARAVWPSWRGGEKVALAPKTFEVVSCLLSRAGEVVLKEELFKEVWPTPFVEESNLTQHIFWIRKALADKADYGVTIPGRGWPERRLTNPRRRQK